ncbi:MAG: hypothetical protein II621_00370, partial [Clostridia bacterium]|nr:hypothetical protein [Clostridia bacterium]
MTRIFYMVVKTLLVYLTVLGVGTGGLAQFYQPGDLTGAVTEPGDQRQYLQMEATDSGWDTYKPGRVYGGYRYGPSMILNEDGSIDLWSAANGTYGFWDAIAYTRLYKDGKIRGKETFVVKPTPGSQDDLSCCDPGVIKFGGYYYVGYTSTMDERGVDNDVYVARSKKPGGPYEKWDGKGWGGDPVPLLDWQGDPNVGGAMEPAFVLMGDTLYIYSNWGGPVLVSTADATDENWPATVVMRGEAIPDTYGDIGDVGDSKDVKYVDAFGRFVAVCTTRRFSDESYVSVWESFDGLTFRPSGFVKTNTARKLHNCGISGRSDGHICEGDPVYLSYGYGPGWGTWGTRMHHVTLSLADAPKTNPENEQNLDIPVETHKERAIPEI